MVFQSILNLVNICADKGVDHIVISPGSRSAPLTLAFARHGGFKIQVAGDERAAGFLGLGMAQALQKPVALVCTSGTAAYNYAPAIAEAYYQEVPLLVLTADRPQEWIDQKDGQTIRQQDLYGSHVKKSYTLPAELNIPEVTWQVERCVSEGINMAQTHPMGPVHINIPFREPFYPKPGDQYEFKGKYKSIDLWTGKLQLTTEMIDGFLTDINSCTKIMVIAGQHELHHELANLLGRLSVEFGWVVLGDVIANLHGENFIKGHDIFLLSPDIRNSGELAPELLITYGKSVLSKGLKQFIRTNKPLIHWHLAPYPIAADTFQSLTGVIMVEPLNFFSEIINRSGEIKTSSEYQAQIKQLERKTKPAIEAIGQEGFSEFEAVKLVLQNLPPKTDLHFANSMPVRYGNFLQSLLPNDVNVFANRGTSGIDGSNSTALGHALVKTNIQVLITGDMAFFYDRNAFWQRNIPSNLLIILLNNHGGGIFNLIDGPSGLPEASQFFVTENPIRATDLARENNMEYYFCDHKVKLKEYLVSFFVQGERSRLLEIETKHELNIKAYKNFKNLIRKNYEA